MEPFSLEDALQQLDEIVRRLESGELSLEAAVALFEQGQALVQQCEKDLDAKELRIQQILENGAVAALD
ncbi:MAG: exodeoxyribonuclease VII small subunit [Anaerolineae bacterium]|nr:exodeoxyribonuclease VII small subunit [Anaerolineae bacterium]